LHKYVYFLEGKFDILLIFTSTICPKSEFILFFEADLTNWLLHLYSQNHSFFLIV
jgi:hypothetical protein